MGSILIVYATVEGQAGNIAAFMAKRAQSRGYQVDVFAADQVAQDLDLQSYEAVIAGGPVYEGQHSRTLVRWLTRHQDELTELPCAAFAVCLDILSPVEEEREAALAYADDLAEEAGWEPQAAWVFAGALRYTGYNWLKRALLKHGLGSAVEPSEDEDGLDDLDDQILEPGEPEPRSVAVDQPYRGAADAGPQHVEYTDWAQVGRSVDAFLAELGAAAVPAADEELDEEEDEDDEDYDDEEETEDDEAFADDEESTGERQPVFDPANLVGLADEPQRVVCATDFSDSAHSALEMAAFLARKWDAQLQVVHVFHMPTYLEWSGGTGVAPTQVSYVDELRHELKVELDAICEGFDDLEVSPILVDGDPPKVLVDLSQEADLLVLGTHGRTGLARVLLGSVAERVVRLSHCPVLTVPAPAATAEAEG